MNVRAQMCVLGECVTLNAQQCHLALGMCITLQNNNNKKSSKARAAESKAFLWILHNTVAVRFTTKPKAWQNLLTTMVFRKMLQNKEAYHQKKTETPQNALKIQEKSNEKEAWCLNIRRKEEKKKQLTKKWIRHHTSNF